jgi:hypothetical protein
MTFNTIKSQQAAIVQDGFFSSPPPPHHLHYSLQQFNSCSSASCNSWKPYQYSSMRVRPFVPYLIRRRKNEDKSNKLLNNIGGYEGLQFIAMYMILKKASGGKSTDFQNVSYEEGKKTW